MKQPKCRTCGEAHRLGPCPKVRLGALTAKEKASARKVGKKVKAPVAQRTERRTTDAEVVGSIPARGAKKALVAQRIERRPPKAKAAGSSPAEGSTLTKYEKVKAWRLRNPDKYRASQRRAQAAYRAREKEKAE